VWTYKLTTGILSQEYSQLLGQFDTAILNSFMSVGLHMLYQWGCAVCEFSKFIIFFRLEEQ
jgi:hypothetical protein